MSKFLSTLSAAVVGISLLGAAGTARADWPWDYTAIGGYNWGFQRYALTNNQMPPYFAMYPPVYYRAPIQARTFGTTPFAYPPCNCSSVAVIEPEVIENPHVQPDADAKPMPPAKPKAPGKGKSARAPRRIEPLVIINPYVTEPATALADKSR